MPLALDEADVGGDEQGAEEDDVVAKRAFSPDSKRITGNRRGSHDGGDCKRPDLIEMFGDDDADAGGDQHHAEPGERPQLSPDRDDVAALANQHQLRIRRVRLWTTTAILAERSRFPANIEAERTTINVKSMNMKRLLGPVHKVSSLSAHPVDAAHGRREHTVSTPLPDDNTIFGKCGSEVGFDEAPYQRRPPAIRHAIDDAQPVGELDHHR